MLPYIINLIQGNKKKREKGMVIDIFISLVTWAKKEAEKSLKEKGVSLEYTKTV